MDDEKRGWRIFGLRIRFGSQCVGLLLVFFVSLSLHGETSRNDICLFFDLGENTILFTDHHEGGEPTGDLIDLRYMQGTKAYLTHLKERGYVLGLITNIPPDWGIWGLKQYVAGWDILSGAERKVGEFHATRWTGQELMDWSAFGDRILVPESLEERKPRHPDPPFTPGELSLYRRAKELAEVYHCKILYQTGIAFELKAARLAGLYPQRHGDEGEGARHLVPESEFENIIARQDANP